MNKVELLAPAGSFEALVAAIQNGCDALYLGGTMFGARAFANNFEEDELQQAVAYAHTYGVKVYVTVNTLIKEQEMEACLSYVERLQKMDVDALIIQDLGLFMLVRKCFPDFEVHASTQMHIHNPEGITLLQKLGATRVVLPRETSIEEIRKYHKLGVELEVFVQGALCISYSGQCLMSAMTLGRSGNRGACAQSCRMQYTLEKQDENGSKIVPSQGKYLLSPKDLNTLAHIPALIDAGITSFKIEGRMKSPEYVALMVGLYRKAINAYTSGIPFVVDQAIEEDMQKIFHRGFTSGHLFHQQGKDLMNFQRPNHIGIPIGTVLNFQGDKIQIKLDKELQQGDGIRILSSRQDEGFTINRIYRDGMLVNHGEAGSIIEIDKTFFVEKGAKVLKTSDIKQRKQLQFTYQQATRKVSAFATFYMHASKKAILEVVDEEGFMAHIESVAPCESAHTAPLTQERMDMQLHRTKNTPFQFEEITYDMDENSVLPIKEINRMRREVLEELQKKREVRHFQRRSLSLDITYAQPASTIEEVIYVAHTKAQYQAIRQYSKAPIYIANSALNQELKTESNVYERTPRVMKKSYDMQHALIQEVGGLYHNMPYLCDSSFNVTNMYSAELLFSCGAQGVCFSLENTKEECFQISDDDYERTHREARFIYPVYGRDELMLSEYCMINTIENASVKKHCGLCQKAEYTLLDIAHNRYPILCDEDCRMHILHSKVRQRIHDIPLAQQHHIHSFLCVFTKETREECEQVLNMINGVLHHE